VIPPGEATDPAKLAEPKPSPEGKVPGAVPVDAKTYIIGLEDVVLISVWEQPQLSCTCVVRSDGKITVPLINEITAAGLTPLELGKALTEDLSAKALVNPLVTVSLVGAHSKKYYLYGQVKAPGVHDLVVPIRAMEAIVSAGGFQDFADQKNITILRGDKRLKFNFREVLAGKKLQQNIYIESGDIIVVK
jgi:polysaccharide export outer membrane protein